MAEKSVLFFFRRRFSGAGFLVAFPAESVKNIRVVMNAVGRGKWDRRTTDEERKGAARQRLLEATEAVVAVQGAAATAAEIIGRAGVGRNTFYEHFESVQGAVEEVSRAATEQTLAALRSSSSGARTPRERLRALAFTWLQAASQRPLVAGALGLGLRTDAVAALMNGLESELCSALELARSAGAVSLPAEGLRVVCLVGAFVTAASYVTRKPDVDVRASADALADLTLRVFR
jgi:AcrR family transcriptional regulator